MFLHYVKLPVQWIHESKLNGAEPPADTVLTKFRRIFFEVFLCFYGSLRTLYVYLMTSYKMADKTRRTAIVERHIPATTHSNMTSLTHLPLDNGKWPLCRRRDLQKMHFGSNSSGVCCLVSNWQSDGIGSENGLALNRRQVIAWNNVDQVHWHIYTALGGDELKVIDWLIVSHNISSNIHTAHFPHPVTFNHALVINVRNWLRDHLTFALVFNAVTQGGTISTWNTNAALTLTQWGRMTHICVNKLSIIVQTLDWHRPGDKPLSEPMRQYC